MTQPGDSPAVTESSPELRDEQMAQAKQLTEQVLYELKKVIVGQEHLLERLILAVLVEGHVLVEGAPGLAKTLTLNTLAKVMNLDFKRIQFTPDLLPADLVGTRIYNPAQGAFSTELGPVFSNFILADEINRSPAKVQSALLEAMQERQVTLGRDTFPLPRPFLVMATQNPIESEGTYPLPEAQLDRFLFKVLVDYPSAREELAIVQRMAGMAVPAVKPLLTMERLQQLQQWVHQVYMDPTTSHYIVDLVQATRSSDHRDVQFGASPRASLALTVAGKALALIRGRSYVTPDDVEELALDCLRHRVILSYEAMARGRHADMVLAQVMASVPKPSLNQPPAQPVSQ